MSPQPLAEKTNLKCTKIYFIQKVITVHNVIKLRVAFAVIIPNNEYWCNQIERILGGWRDGSVCRGEVKESPSMMEIQKKIPKTETLLRNMWFGDKYQVNRLKALSLVASGEEWYRRQSGSYCFKGRFIDLFCSFKMCRYSFTLKWFNLHTQKTIWFYKYRVVGRIRHNSSFWGEKRLSQNDYSLWGETCKQVDECNNST